MVRNADLLLRVPPAFILNALQLHRLCGAKVYALSAVSLFRLDV